MEPPESPNWEFRIEITDGRETSSVTQVHMLVVAVQLTESADNIWLLVRNVVVNPHPPARVEVSHGQCEVVEELSVPGCGAVTGPAICVVPGARGPPGGVVRVAQHILATAQGAAVVVTARRSHVTPVRKCLKGRGRNVRN